MLSKLSASPLWSLFSELPDPRQDKNKRHDFQEILILSLCACLCGADGFVGIEQFCLAKEAWFRTFLTLPSGIPSHDTLGRVFAALDPSAFADCLTRWVCGLQEKQGPHIAIDGKTLRKSFDRAKQQSALHLVSAWATETGLLLGQEKTQDKSNEITAIPNLLRLLDLQDTVVTIDAMGCQTQIAQRIQSQGGNYVLALKENQATLSQDVTLFFQDPQVWKEAAAQTHTTVEKDHGRIEQRTATVVSSLDWLDPVHKRRWPGLQSLIQVHRIRDLGTNVEQDTGYYLSSLSTSPAHFLQIIRGHWQIENALHWVMDVVFSEDACRIRTQYAAQNMASVRRMALMMLKQDKTLKVGLAIKRQRAGWDTNYLLTLLQL